jgi:uncharacterized protein YqjF (DUF2071 family)
MSYRYNLTVFDAALIMHYVIGVLKVFQKKGCIQYHEVRLNDHVKSFSCFTRSCGKCAESALLSLQSYGSFVAWPRGKDFSAAPLNSERGFKYLSSSRYAPC